MSKVTTDVMIRKEILLHCGKWRIKIKEGFKNDVCFWYINGSRRVDMTLMEADIDDLEALIKSYRKMKDETGRLE